MSNDIKTKPTFKIYLANWAMAHNIIFDKLTEVERKIAYEIYVKLYESET